MRLRLRRTDRDYIADAIGAIVGSAISFVLVVLGFLLLIVAGRR